MRVATLLLLFLTSLACADGYVYPPDRVQQAHSGSCFLCCAESVGNASGRPKLRGLIARAGRENWPQLLHGTLTADVPALLGQPVLVGDSWDFVEEWSRKGEPVIVGVRAWDGSGAGHAVVVMRVGTEDEWVADGWGGWSRGRRVTFLDPNDVRLDYHATADWFRVRLLAAWVIKGK